MSPTVLRDGPFRRFFFSREEERMHVHVAHPAGEAKFVAEVRDSVGRVFSDRLMPHTPSIQALDTSAVIAAIGVRRDHCP